MDKEIKIFTKKITSKDPRLNRHIYHDPKSKQFTFNTAGLTIKSVKHTRHIDALDQDQVGSCTGNAGIGDLATTPLFEALPKPLKYSLDENGAVKLYSDAEKIDGGVGYPPQDNGSYGLSIAKALVAAGMVAPAYQHTFTLEDALKAGQLYPFITGVKWYSGMYNPDPDGRVHVTGSLRGGHEFQMDEIDAENGRIWFYNSWNKTWGLNGRFYLTWEDYANLLKDYGDVTILFPKNTVVPLPVPTITITREKATKKETTGSFVAINGGSQLVGKTLELPDLNNAKNISCIPKGTYNAVYTLHPTKKTYLYLLQNVPNRSGIYIHIGNYFKDVAGCILLGATLADINKDGELDVTSSTITINAFMALMAKTKTIKVIIQ